MTDPFANVADELMTRSSDAGGDAAATSGASTPARSKKHVCPYCGAVMAIVEKPAGPCPRCNMEDTPATRAATKARIGPWYVLQSRNPAAPGMRWATLLSLVAKGQVTPRSIIRGPTTHQLWKFAAHVKGLSREFNLCFSCGGEIERTANQCSHCDRLQEPPINPDTLLESREATGPRVPIQKEIRPALTTGSSTDLVLAGPQPSDVKVPRNPEEGILSAKELAAAFQLDFNPQTGAITAPLSSRKPKRRGGILLVLLLLVLVGGSAVLYAKPDYREKTLAWAKQATSSAKAYWASMSQKPVTVSSTPRNNDTAAGDQPAPLAAQAEADSSESIAPPPPSAEQQSQFAHDPEPAPVPAATVVVANPTPAAPPPRSVQQPMVDLDAPIPSDRAAQKDLEQRLWLMGHQADENQDFKLSVRCYERIKQLDVPHHSDVEDRLSWAKNHLPGK